MTIETGGKARSYKFICEIPRGKTADKVDTIGCSQITGLEQGIEESNVPSGKINTLGQSNPDKINSIEVNLKRGVDINQRFWQWWNFTKRVAESYGQNLQNSNKNFKRTVRVISDVIEHKLIQAYPIKYSVSDFNAKQTSILFEEITLKAQDLDKNIIT